MAQKDAEGGMIHFVAHSLEKPWAMFSIFMGNVFQNYEQRFSKQRATNFTSLPFLFHYAASGLQFLYVL